MVRATTSLMAEDTGDLEWIITDEDGNDLYKIAPYSNHLCYNLFKWDSTTNRETGKEVWSWKDTGYYPSTLDHACDVIRDRMVMSSKVRTKEFTEVKKAITRSTNQIVQAIKEGFANVEAEQNRGRNS